MALELWQQRYDDGFLAWVDASGYPRTAALLWYPGHVQSDVISVGAVTDTGRTADGDLVTLNYAALFFGPSCGMDH